MTIKLLFKDPDNSFENNFFLAVLGLRRCEGFSLVVVNGGYSLVVCSGFSLGVSPVAEHGP